VIHLSYDREGDALYVSFDVDPGQVRPARSERLDDFRGVDVDRDGAPLGVEFLFVSEAGLNLAGVPRAEELAEFFASLRALDVHDSVGWLGSTRRRLGLTQAQLARELGVASNTLALWERGDKPMGNPNMVRLALESIARHHDEQRGAPPPPAAPTRRSRPLQNVAEGPPPAYRAGPGGGKGGRRA
jgi:DNA-binding XRE family transcriptional regulator